MAHANSPPRPLIYDDLPQGFRRWRAQYVFPGGRARGAKGSLWDFLKCSLLLAQACLYFASHVMCNWAKLQDFESTLRHTSPPSGAHHSLGSVTSPLLQKRGPLQPKLRDLRIERLASDSEQHTASNRPCLHSVCYLCRVWHESICNKKYEPEEERRITAAQRYLINDIKCLQI